jgi:enoyl-CoA hydratase/carnithine racemase
MTLLYEKRGKVAWITLNRPQALNAVDWQTFQELSQAFLDFRDDRDCWVAVVTGSGTKAFSAGADIKDILPVLWDLRNDWWRLPSALVRGLELWKPVIAAVNGIAVGGGLELCLACDLRIAAENATFGVPEVKLGVVPGWGGTQRLPRAIPRAKAAEMLFFGESIDSWEAYHIGLVNRVVPLDQLLPTAEAWAERLCQIPPLAIRAAKEAMMKGAEMGLEDGLRLEAKLIDLLFTTEDHKEARQAFLERRKPQIKGR